MEDKIITEIAPLPKPATFKESAKAILRVAAYARVSTDHEDQQSSLAAQTEYYEKKISEHPGWQFVRVYVDDGISGLRTEHREGFNRMVEDCLMQTCIQGYDDFGFDPLVLIDAYLKCEEEYYEGE